MTFHTKYPHANFALETYTLKVWKIFQFNYKEIIISTIISHVHIKQSRNLIWFIISTSTNNDKILLLSLQQICSQGVAAKLSFGVTRHLRPLYQRNSLTTTTTIQHTACICLYQEISKRFVLSVPWENVAC